MSEEKQHYWVDLESGVRYPCSKEYYEGMKRIWNSVRPKLTLPPDKRSVMVITGTTSGENHFLKDIYTAGIDPVSSDKSSVGSSMGMFIPNNWKQVNKEG